jgi:hypothetical protein
MYPSTAYESCKTPYVFDIDVGTILNMSIAPTTQLCCGLLPLATHCILGNIRNPLINGIDLHSLARGLEERDPEDIFSRQINFQCIVFCVTLLPFVIFCCVLWS